MDSAKVTPAHPFLQKQTELMKAVCLAALTHSLFLYIALLYPLIILSLSPSMPHNAFIGIFSPHPLTERLLQSRGAYCCMCKLFQQCFCPSFLAEFHKIILIKLDMILEGTKKKKRERIKWILYAKKQKITIKQTTKFAHDWIPF